MAPSSSLSSPTIQSELAIYLLQCSVCSKELFSRKDWLHHLTTENHQNLAKTQCLEQQDVNKYKECCLILFTTHDLTINCAKNVIDYFAGKNYGNFVTDFLWWEDRPKIGIVQFESRPKAEEILNGIKTGIQIGSQWVQAQGAFEISGSQWKALLPGNNPLPVEKAPSQIEKEEQEKKLRELLYLDITNSASPVSALNEFANDQRWRMPEYRIKKLRIPGKTVYLCTMFIDGMTYRPPPNVKNSYRPRIAKNKTALFYMDSVGHPFAKKFSLSLLKLERPRENMS